MTKKPEETDIKPYKLSETASRAYAVSTSILSHFKHRNTPDSQLSDIEKSLIKPACNLLIQKGVPLKLGERVLRHIDLNGPDHQNEKTADSLTNLAGALAMFFNDMARLTTEAEQIPDVYDDKTAFTRQACERVGKHMSADKTIACAVFEEIADYFRDVRTEFRTQGTGPLARAQNKTGSYSL